MHFLDLPFYDRALRGLFAAICQLIYPLIAWLYNLFINISRVDILSEEYVRPMYQRVTMLLTIVMIFYVTFQFVKFIVQPDEITDKEKGAGKIIYKMVIVVVLIAFVPKIFTGAYELQKIIMKNDLIGKVMLGTSNDESKKFGQVFAANLFSVFYSFQPNEDMDIDTDEECDGAECRQIVNMNLRTLKEEGQLTYLTVGLNDSKKVKNVGVEGRKENVALIEFNYLMATGVGIVVAIMIGMYCIEAGTRWAQLVFLQIIAPIPIIGYLSPKKDGIFQKWLSQCITTYLDLFIRMGIIYFVLLICQVLTDAMANNTLLEELKNESELSDWMITFIYIALILGTLLFAKKAPKMLQELFPKSNAASGNFGLNPGERFAPLRDIWKGARSFGNGIRNMARPIGRIGGAAAGAAIGAGAGLATGIGQGIRRAQALKKDGSGEKKGIGAGIGGGIWGGIRGAAGGLARGAYQGSKKGNVFKNSVQGAKDQIKSNRRFGDQQELGYGLGEQIGDKARSTFGTKSRLEKKEETKQSIADQNTRYKDVMDTRKKIEERALDKINEEGGKSGEKSREYFEKKQRLSDIENPANENNPYRVSKYKDEEEANKAYEDAKLLAENSVNKENFKKSDGGYDEEAYERTKQAARDSVNKNDYAVGYATQEEADKARSAEIQRLKAEISGIKDDAVAEYVANSGDAMINSELELLNGRIKSYNTTVATDRQIHLDNFENGDEAVDASAIKSNFTEFSKYVKGAGVQNKQNANASQLVDIEKDITRLKQEQETLKDKK